MIALGNNILIRPDERKLEVNGVIIPETAKPPAQETGVVVMGNKDIPSGTRVKYFGRKCFEKDGLKVVNVKKVLVWDF